MLEPSSHSCQAVFVYSEVRIHKLGSDDWICIFFSGNGKWRDLSKLPYGYCSQILFLFWEMSLMKENGAYLRYDINSSLISKNEDFLKEMDGRRKQTRYARLCLILLLVEVSSGLDISCNCVILLHFW